MYSHNINCQKWNRRGKRCPILLFLSVCLCRKQYSVLYLWKIENSWIGTILRTSFQNDRGLWNRYLCSDDITCMKKITVPWITAVDIWILAFVLIIWWKHAIFRQFFLIRYRIGSDRTLPRAFNSFIVLHDWVLSMVHGTWQVPGEFGIVIFDENARKHLVLFQEFSNHFGMANAVVSN